MGDSRRPRVSSGLREGGGELAARAVRRLRCRVRRAGERRGEPRGALAVERHREPGALALGERGEGAQHARQLLVHEQPQPRGRCACRGGPRACRAALVRGRSSDGLAWRSCGASSDVREAEDLVLARGTSP